MATDSNGKTIIYVSSSGSDGNSGLEANAPLASLDAAVAASRALSGSETIELAGGDYYLTKTVALNAADNGLTITSAPGATATLHGGPNVAGGWTDNGDGSFSKSIADLGLTASVEDLHVNGDRVQEARFPNAAIGEFNAGYLLTAAGTDGYGATTLKFDPGAIPAISDTSDLRVSVYGGNQWSNANPTVASVDSASGTITLSESIPWHDYGADARFYLYSSADLLDAPGEFDYDSSTQTITVIPNDPAALAEGNSVTASMLDSLILINGASGITIDGLGLTDTTYHGSDRSLQWSQGSGGAVAVSGSSGIAVTDNQIDDVGVGVNASSVSDLSITGNTITDVAGNGVYIAPVHNTGNLNSNVTVADNTIQNTGTVAVETGGVWATGLVDSTISGNSIADSAQMGILVGSTRSNGTDPSYGNTINGNVIRNVNTATADGAGIKLFGAADGAVHDNAITNNGIDGVTQSMTRPDGSLWGEGEWSSNTYPQPIAAGVYLDTRVAGTEIAGNVIANSYGGVYIYGGSDNAVHDNVLYSNVGASIDLANIPGLAMTANTVSENVTYLDDDQSAAIRVSNSTADNAIASFSNNTYYGPELDGDAFLTWGSRLDSGAFGGTFEEWTQANYAISGEQKADALLADVAAGNYQPAEGSPVWTKGFDGIDPALLAKLTGSGVVSPPPTTTEPVDTADPGTGTEAGGADTPAAPDEGTGGTTITVDVAGDAYGNSWDAGPNPEFKFYVNGEQVGETTAVTADHGSGEWQGVSFATDLAGSEITSLAVEFVNDYAGVPYSPENDRNLWVQGVTVNGTTFTAGEGAVIAGDGSSSAGVSGLYTNAALTWSTAGKIGGADPVAATTAPAEAVEGAGSAETAASGSETFTIAIDAASDHAGDASTGGPAAELELYVNGEQVGQTTAVTTEHDSGDWQTLGFEVTMDPADLASLAVAFVNDDAAEGADSTVGRNLWVQDVTVQGTTLAAADGVIANPDGSIQPGQEVLYSNAALGFDLSTLVASA